ncbi:methionine--tRNA ligase [Candidatus Parcubacteria bacterium]|uniref:Methionine--tRNA ligase n=1 Tax=Candidatus Kaiserbacteria bacterium CG10_big_fil_rev_8_21_14_0_10_47_16 TaxID=1974608 RepID=A0A2H0UEL4_9BACT|nr:methionine--tRNA ligase [Candidatus Parcubacteria bacterium]PIR84842.1 MAG: methionine--tRNA ligase [Candidatus Kaiserbacteria bacterium CG10_big_fil_rev_8_21_14_0_10_47_16]
MEKEKFYLTTTLPYVNAKPHIGFALEIVQADVIARYQTLVGKDVFFNTGTDEHGQKVYEKALEAGTDTQRYTDELSLDFKNLLGELGVLPEIHFIRTTNPHHKEAAQEMWRRCDANGDIYKAKQIIKYCKGCELEKTDSELIDGKCHLHPNLEIEIREEENYFFRFSKYGEKLLAFYAEHPDFVVPDYRFNEIKKFVEGGLQDFSVSRLKEKMSWGVPVPGDDDHVMYVWFDALTNYISTTGWPEKEDFGGYWPGIQFAGKDNLRQQSAIWAAMLLSAGLPLPKQIVIHGFITSGGAKMSKSLGNVIDPLTVKEKYGTEALRYFLARHVHPFEDTDVTMEKVHEAYTANLVNGLGNLVSRVMKMAEDNLEGPVSVEDTPIEKDFRTQLDAYRLDAAFDLIYFHIQKGDELIQETTPFKKVKSDNPTEVAEGKEVIEKLVKHIYRIAEHLVVFMPETAEKIKEAVRENKKPENLFVRID